MEDRNTAVISFGVSPLQFGPGGVGPLCRKRRSVIELVGQAANIAAVIGFGFWSDRRTARLFREIGERLDVIDARLAALEVKPNGVDPHVAQRANFEGRPN